MTTPMSQAGYAAHRKARGLRGTTARSVRRALAAGRIHAERGGGIDPARADAEWAESTRLRVDGNSSAPASTLSAMTLRERTARAKTLELELKRKTGELLPRRDVELAWSKIIVESRTAVLGAPSKIRQRLPHLSPGDVSVIQFVLRECLEGLADTAAAMAEQA